VRGHSRQGARRAEYAGTGGRVSAGRPDRRDEARGNGSRNRCRGDPPEPERACAAPASGPGVFPAPGRALNPLAGASGWAFVACAAVAIGYGLWTLCGSGGRVASLVMNLAGSRSRRWACRPR
jgi:hypothetical protein